MKSESSTTALSEAAPHAMALCSARSSLSTARPEAPLCSARSSLSTSRQEAAPLCNARSSMPTSPYRSMASYISFGEKPERMTETRRSSLGSIGVRALASSHSHPALATRARTFASSNENGLAFPDASADAEPTCFRRLGPPRPHRRMIGSAHLTKRRIPVTGKKNSGFGEYEKTRRTWRDDLVGETPRLYATNLTMS